MEQRREGKKCFKLWIVIKNSAAEIEMERTKHAIKSEDNSHSQIGVLRNPPRSSQQFNLRVEKASTLVYDCCYENVENTSPYFRHCEENSREWSVANINVPGDGDGDDEEERRGKLSCRKLTLALT
jgi:hypothetical protein